MKDLRSLNLNECRLSQKAFNEIIASPQLRSLEVLLMNKNRVVTVQGPYCDLEDLDEKQVKKQLVMRLKVLDLRENRISQIFLKDAVTFLRETVVLLWGNPFPAETLSEIQKEYDDPACMFRATSEFEDDYKQIRNPLHIYKPLQNNSPIMKLLDGF